MSRHKGKRSAEAAFATADTSPQSLYLPLFEQVRDELDEHHDRRERVIKASRDITAASKKIIFSLQRLRKVGEPIPKDLQKPREWETIRTQYETIVSDLQGINAYRYSHNVTGGNQELMEAMAFQHYLETQCLINVEEARKKVAAMCPGDICVTLSESDYLLGIFDMVGELMRFAITSMSRGGLVTAAAQPKSMDTDGTNAAVTGGQKSRSVLADLRELRTHLELLDVTGSSVARDYGKKLGVMQECVEKVEKASYGQIVRGSERPKGWIPEIEDRREEVEAV